MSKMILQNNSEFKLYLFMTLVACQIIPGFASRNITEREKNMFADEGDHENVISSTHQLRELLENEIRFVNNLRDYLSVLKKEVHFVQDYLNSEYNHDLNQISDLEGYISNPLNAFGVVKRSSFSFWNKFKLTNRQAVITTALEKLQDSSSHFIGIDQYQQTAANIALLQESYDLSTEDLSNGEFRLNDKIVNDSQYEMEWRDFCHIGITAANKGMLDHGIDWLQKCFEKAPNKTNDAEELEELRAFKRSYRGAIKTHDHFLDTRGPTGVKHRCFTVPFDEKLAKKKKYKKAKKAKSKRVTAFNVDDIGFNKLNDQTTIKNERAMAFTCKTAHGSNLGAAANTFLINPKFSCRYQHHGDPHLRLGPFKVEEVNDQPFVAIFHDFLSDLENARLKEVAEDNLSLSRLGGEKANMAKRSSKQTWVHDSLLVGCTHEQKQANLIPPYVGCVLDHPKYRLDNDTVPVTSSKRFMVGHQGLYKISHRIERATRLVTANPFAAEPYQIANYGIGGQYGLHWDPFGDTFSSNPEAIARSMNDGDRLATVMIYLSSVEMAGGTAFPVLKTYIEAEKNAALFWINLKLNGEREYSTIHGGCPVLVGSKWITNKWIRYNENMFHHPCGLSKEERHNFLRPYRDQNLALKRRKI